MKNFILVNKQTMEVVANYSSESVNLSKFGGQLSRVDIYDHVECPEGVDPESASVSWDSDLSEYVVSTDAVKAASKLEEARNQKLNIIRSKRSEKLVRVDQLVNVAFLNSWTAGEKTELKNYRQALLDITESYKNDMPSLDSLDVNSIVWPAEPSET